MIMNLLFVMAVDRVVMPLEWETKHSSKSISIDELTAIQMNLSSWAKAEKLLPIPFT